MGLFDNLFYPDNKNRALRASQLAQDCGDFAVSISSDKEKVERLLLTANEIIQRAYQGLVQKPVPYTSVSIDPESWVANTVEIIAPVISMAAVNKALFVAARSWLLRQGRIGEAAFADLVGLPRWMKVGQIMGGLAAAVAVEAIIASIDGAIQREKLREAIHDLIDPRIKLKRNAMINGQVLLTLQSVIAAYTAITNVPGVTFTQVQLDAIAKNLVDQNTIQVGKFTEAAAREELAIFDKERGAWTNEDNLWALKAVVAAYKAITEIPDAAFTDEQLDAIAQSLVQQSDAQIDDVSKGAARALLVQFENE